MLTPDESARLRSDWAARKAARGAPIPAERMARLQPHHLTGAPTVAAQMAEVHDITERCRQRVRSMIGKEERA